MAGPKAVKGGHYRPPDRGFKRDVDGNIINSEQPPLPREVSQRGYYQYMPIVSSAMQELSVTEITARLYKPVHGRG